MAFDIGSVDMSVIPVIAGLSDTGVAHSSKYWIEFNSPATGKLMGGACEQMTMPSRTYMTTEHTHVGNTFRAPYTSSYQPVTVTMALSGSLVERTYFEAWQNLISNIDNNTMGFYNDYVTDVNMYQLDTKGNTVYQIILKEAYPVTIGEVSYAFDAYNMLPDCAITFSYRYWKNKS